jgi:hypothetical protein
MLLLQQSKYLLKQMKDQMRLALMEAPQPQQPSCPDISPNRKTLVANSM